MYKKNKKWLTLHISLDINNLSVFDDQVEESVKSKLEKSHLKRQWKTIDIVDIKIVSSTYQPTKDTTFVELLVFVVDMTGEQI